MSARYYMKRSSRCKFEVLLRTAQASDWMQVDSARLGSAFFSHLASLPSFHPLALLSNSRSFDFSSTRQFWSVRVYFLCKRSVFTHLLETRPRKAAAHLQAASFALRSVEIRGSRKTRRMRHADYFVINGRRRAHRDRRRKASR